MTNHSVFSDSSRFTQTNAQQGSNGEPGVAHARNKILCTLPWGPWAGETKTLQFWLRQDSA
jgi:hypothetical protein